MSASPRTIVYRNAWFAAESAPAGSPLASFRGAAIERLKKAGFPTLKTESWKYLDLSALLDETWRLDPERPESVPDVLRDRITALDSIPVRWVNQYQVDLCASRSCPEGMSAVWMSEASAQTRRLAEESLADTGETSSDAFRMANAALSEDVLVLRVHDGVKLGKPVQVSQITASLEGNTAIHRRVVFSAGRNSESQVVLDISGDEGPASLINFVFDIRLAEGAKLDLVISQRGGSESRHILSLRVSVGANGVFNASLLAHTGKLVRTDMDVSLQGTGAKVDLSGLSVLSGEGRVHHRVTLNHEAPDCESDQLFKAILAGGARYEYTGRVEVARGAHGTRSGQLNRNLVLSDDASVYVRPQLRIQNDDVKCSHGSSTGQLEPDEVFYLQSRGIDEATARTLLSFGFAEEMILKLPVEGFRKVAEADALAALKSAQV